MNQSELDFLSQLLAMLGSAGEGAFTLALIYLTLEYVLPIVFWTFFVIVAYKLVAIFVIEHRAIEAFKRWRIELNTGTRGNLTIREFEDTEAAIDALIAESKGR